MDNYQKFLKQGWLCLALVIAGLTWSISAQAATTCLAPIPANAFVDPFTGNLDLRWIGGSKAKNYTLKILTLGKACSDPATAPGELELQIPGTVNSYTIPDASLDCGKWQYCIQAECCDDGCETCVAEGKVPADADYCTVMAGLMGDRCACPTAEYPIYRNVVSPGDGLPSFHYKCSDGKEYQASVGCPSGTKIVGCAWECTKITTGNDFKSCGKDYDIKCGSVNKLLIRQTPTFNLCSVDGKTNDSYLIPPVVPSLIPPTAYSWTCLGQTPAEQCVACRRAVCNADYLDKALYDLPNSGDLCKDSDGVISGQAQNFVYDEVSKQWTWDCVGRTDCTAPDSAPNITSCIAKKAGCGEANNKFYTLDNFYKLAGDIGSVNDFVCLNGGTPTPVSFSGVGGGWVDQFHYRQIYQAPEPTIDAIFWVCTYPSLGESKCQSNIIDCNSAVKGKKITGKNWLDNYKTADKLCQNGLNSVFSEGTWNITADYQWTCRDNYGGLVSCSMDEVNCKKPPHESYVDDVKALLTADALQMCTAGSFGLTPRIYPKDSDNLIWTCQDDDGYTALDPYKCFTTQLSCAEPPDKGSFNDWKSLVTAGKLTNCSGYHDSDEWTSGSYSGCLGACNDPNKDATLTLKNGIWIWKCGQDDCEAKVLDCAKDDKGNYTYKDQYFGDMTDFRFFVQNKGGSCEIPAGKDKYSCTGVCTIKDSSAEVTFHDSPCLKDANGDCEKGQDGKIIPDPDFGKFTWSCGARPCEALQAGCGEYGVTFKEKVPTDLFKDWFTQAKASGNYTKFCTKGGTPEWFSGHTLPEEGFMPYGNNNLEHEGVWAWQCKYSNGKLYSNGNYVVDSQKYCGLTERPECNLSTDLQGKYTLTELINKSTKDPQLGNAYDNLGKSKAEPFLCKRGILSPNTTNGSAGIIGLSLPGGGSDSLIGLQITTPATAWFANNFAKVRSESLLNDGERIFPGANKNIYLYRCTSPDNYVEGPMCAVDVLGCKASPDGGSYTSDTEFKNAGEYACEGTLTSTGGQFNDSGDNQCKWTWNCGGDNCSATKNGDLTAEITGSASVCAKNANIYSVTNIKGCAPADITVAWAVTPTDPSITGLESSLTIPADTLVDGIYDVTAVVTCTKPVCIKTSAIRIKKQITVSKEEQTATLDLSATSPICKGESITYTAHPDPLCANPSYVWTEPGCAPTSATCKKTYDKADTYQAGDVGVTINCTNCYASKTLNSPEIKVDWYEDPTSVLVTPELASLKLCEGDTTDHVFVAEAQFSDPDITNCTDVGYVWSYGKTKATEVSFSQSATVNLADLALKASDYSITVTAKCKNTCSKKTSVSSSYTIHVYKGPYAGSIEVVPDTICSGKSPTKLQSKMISGLPDDAKDCKTNDLEWQSALAIAGVCPDENSSAWSNTGVYTQDYAPLPTLTETTCYRRVARANQPCTDKYTAPIVVKVETILPQDASMTVDKTPICAKNQDTAIFRAHADTKCENPKYAWTGCTQDATDKAKCSKKYLNRGAYTGEVRVTITCDNCYEDWLGYSPLVTADWFNEPIGVTLTPNPLNVCENNAAQDQTFTAEATYADSLSLYNCTKVKYVWKIDGQTLGGSNNTFDLKTLDPKLSAGKHTISVTAQCEDTCSVKTPTSPPTTADITVNPAPTLSNITPTTESCSANPSTYETTVNHCTAGTVNWTLTNKETGAVYDSNGGITNTSYTPPKDLVGGVYALKVDMTCTNPCSGGDSKTIDITIRKPSIQNLSGLGTICAEAPGDYVAVTKDCDNGAINWTITDKSTGQKIDSMSETDSNVLSFDYVSKYKPGPIKHPKLSPGEYAVTSTLSCLSPCAGDNVKSFDFTVKPQPVLNDTTGNKFDFCSDVPESYASGAKDCLAGDITWTLKDKDGKTVDGPEKDSYNNANYTPKTGLPAGTYTLETALNCTDPCSGTDKKTKTITVNPAPEPGIIAANQDVCSAIEDPAIFTSVNDGKYCDSYQWEKSTVTGQVCDNKWDPILVALARTYDASFLTESTCYHRLCINTCDLAGKATDPLTITVKPQPSFDRLEGDKEFCLANPTEYTAYTSNCDKGTVVFLVIDERTNLPISDSRLQVPISNNSAKYTPQPKPLPTGSGTYSVQATMHCTDPCKVDKLKTLSGIKVYDCQCGSANGKSFVGGAGNTLGQDDITGTTDLTKFKFCKDDIFPDLPLNLKGDGSGWDWQCKYGLDLPLIDCSAKQTKCGTASAQGSGTDRIYTDSSWSKATKGTICINGAVSPTTILATDELDTDEPDSNSCNGGETDTDPNTKTGIKNMWKWNCTDSVGGDNHKLDCSAKRLDCGIADANRVLKNNCEIQPQTGSQPYRGSYSSDPVPEHRCNFGSSLNFRDTDRGKYYWECGLDSLGDIKKCEARRDCGWAGTYPTVDYGYGAGGCWTAKNVKDGSENDSFNWGVATKIGSSWSVCKGTHCKLKPNNPIQGICPDGYVVPSQTQWNNLERTLVDNSNRENCTKWDSAKRTLGTSACSPAGNAGGHTDYMQDGLRDEVTFAGASGENYWTSDTSFNKAPLCGGSSPCYCQKTLYYYGLGSGSTVTLNADNGNCTSVPIHELRCVKAGSAGLIGGGGEDTQKCYGWGCSN